MEENHYSRCRPSATWLWVKVGMVCACFAITLGLQGTLVTSAESSDSLAVGFVGQRMETPRQYGSFTDLSALIPVDQVASVVTVTEEVPVLPPSNDSLRVPVQQSDDDIDTVLDESSTAVVEPVLLEKAAPVATPSGSEELEQQVAQQLYEAMNQERRAKDLSPLQISPRLVSPALAYAEAVAEHGTITHDIEGTCGASCRFAAHDVPLRSWGENLGWWQGGARLSLQELRDSLMQGWLNSPGHRANILSSEFTSMGVGVVHRADEWFVVVHFGAF